MGMIIMASLGAAVGSVCRFLIQTRFTSNATKTTLAINWIATLLAGMIYASNLPTMLNTFVMAGFIGGFSTFSGPIIVLADALPDKTKRWRVFGNVIILFIGGLVLFQVGMQIVCCCLGG